MCVGICVGVLSADVCTYSASAAPNARHHSNDVIYTASSLWQSIPDREWSDRHRIAPAAATAATAAATDAPHQPHGKTSLSRKVNLLQTDRGPSNNKQSSPDERAIGARR